ncbi:MAG TPA: hypothetical protein VML92_08990 [Steroidobacteraceae bacterium]|nr:hypothetical protein [Steroidobacteraceae bacterium]
MNDGERYSEVVRRLFETLPFGGPLPDGAGLPVTGEAMALDRGAWVRFEARVLRGRFVACSFRAWGCPHVLAAAAQTAERLSGSSVDGAGTCDARELIATLGAPVEKLGRFLVVEDAHSGLLTAARAVQFG